jgi:predicted nucleic acid-binding protein
VTERVFLDTNVVVYLLAEDPAKAGRAESLLAARPWISAQVVNEFINVCVKKLGFSRAAAHENARALMAGCEVAPLEPPRSSAPCVWGNATVFPIGTP